MGAKKNLFRELRRGFSGDRTQFGAAFDHASQLLASEDRFLLQQHIQGHSRSSDAFRDRRSQRSVALRLHRVMRTLAAHMEAFVARTTPVSLRLSTDTLRQILDGSIGDIDPRRLAILRAALLDGLSVETAVREAYGDVYTSQEVASLYVRLLREILNKARFHEPQGRRRSSG